MKVVSFGDSFTAGLGTDRVVEEKIFENKKPENIQELRTKHNNYIVANSFTKYFADKLNVEYHNNGDIGSNNKQIISKVFKGYTLKQYKSGDLVLVAFTSSLRDRLPFAPEFYNQNTLSGIQWSTKELIRNSNFEWKKEEYLSANNVNKFKEPLIDEKSDRILSYFLDSYPKYFTENLYDEYYIDFFNQNMILMLQKFFNDIEVDYILIDAFENSIRNTQYDKTYLIDKSKYWGYNSKSIHRFLSDFNDPSYLELDGYNLNNLVPKHPSRKGHQAFAEELYRFYTNE